MRHLQGIGEDCGDPLVFYVLQNLVSYRRDVEHKVVKLDFLALLSLHNMPLYLNKLIVIEISGYNFPQFLSDKDEILAFLEPRQELYIETFVLFGGEEDAIDPLIEAGVNYIFVDDWHSSTPQKLNIERDVLC